MKGKVCLITGATAGIGEVAAIEIARKGADVIFIARNESRAKSTLAKIQAAASGNHCSYILADLSSREQTLRAAAEFKSKFDRLDVLINNAGAIYFNDQKSCDGIEMTWALNHFGYFWLTLELLDLLKASAPSRIINVSSAAHKRATFASENLVDPKNSFCYFTYGNTKLANVLFTNELATMLEGSGVTVNALHPGVVATNFGGNNGVAGQLFKTVSHMFSISCEEGARTIIYLATSPDVEKVSGKYFVEEKEARTSSRSKDKALAERLWSISKKMTEETDARLGAK